MTLFNPVTDRNKNTTLTVYSDPEGNKAYLQQVDEHTNNLLRAKGIEETASTLVFLGDACDKGPNNLEIVRDIYTVAMDPTGKTLVSIAGNRDYTELRWLELANEQYITKDFLGGHSDTACYWNTNVSPHKFCQFLFGDKAKLKPHHQALKAELVTQDENLTANSDREAFKQAYGKLDFSTQRHFVARYMGEKTLGAPDRFDFQRQELATILGRKESEVSNDEVIQSLIEPLLTKTEYNSIFLNQNETNKILPSNNPLLPAEYRTAEGTGLVRWLLSNSDMVQRVGSILVSHGPLSDKAFLKKQDGSCEEYNFQEMTAANLDQARLDAWLDARNTRARQHVESFIASYFTGEADAFSPPSLADGLSKHPAITAALPQGCVDSNHGAVQSVNPMNRNTGRYDCLLSEASCAALTRAGVAMQIHGHQPVGFAAPIILKKYGITSVNADTSMSDMKDQNPQKRGGGAAGIVVTDTCDPEQAPSLFIRGNLSDCYLNETLGNQREFSVEIDFSDPYGLLGHEIVTSDGKTYSVTATIRGTDGLSNWLFVQRDVAQGFSCIKEVAYVPLSSKEDIDGINAEFLARTPTALRELYDTGFTAEGHKTPI